MRYPRSFDAYDDDDDAPPKSPECNRCGATDVRWRQQGGKWALFSLRPGVVHECPPLSADEFD